VRKLQAPHSTVKNKNKGLIQIVSKDNPRRHWDSWEHEGRTKISKQFPHEKQLLSLLMGVSLDLNRVSDEISPNTSSIFPEIEDFKNRVNQVDFGFSDAGHSRELKKIHIGPVTRQLEALGQLQAFIDGFHELVGLPKNMVKWSANLPVKP
jgi:hypothetical protein